MKKGSTAVGMMAMVAMMVWGVQEAQGDNVKCLSGAGDGVPFDEANAFVQFIRELQEPAAGTICTKETISNCEPFVSPEFANVAVTICAPAFECFRFDDLGNYLNEILSQCNEQNNEVQGVYKLGGGERFFFTTTACVYDCQDAP